MKWKAKPKVQVGEYRIKKVYPILPLEIDGYYYWLEKVSVLQRLCGLREYSYFKSEYVDVERWTDIRVADKLDIEQYSDMKSE